MVNLFKAKKEKIKIDLSENLLKDFTPKQKEEFAKELQGNPLLSIIFKEIENDFIALWLNSKNVGERENCHIGILLVGVVQHKIQQYITLAEAEKKIQEKRKEKLHV